MRRSFYLLAGVIAAQLAIGIAVITSCIIKSNPKCADGKVATIFDTIAAQTFALYAAETAQRNKNND